MLVDLTINIEEVERRKQVCKEFNIPEVSLCSHPDNHLGTGIYRCGCDHNFSMEEFQETENLTYNDQYLAMVRTWSDPDENGNRIPLDMDSQYGVADSIDQIKEYYKVWLEDPDTKWIITVTPVFQHKENEGLGGGWRWHKWGPYIGKLKPEYIYLDDEDFGEDFQGYVLCYHIYPIR